MGERRSPGGAPRVLVVDDDPRIVRLLVFTLERAGYQVRAFRCGRTALELLPHLRPDIVIVDALLSGLDGPTICRRIRAAGLRETAVLLLTTWVDEAMVRRCLEAGADMVVHKPFSPLGLLETLTALRRRRSGVTASKAQEDAPGSAGLVEPAG